MNPLGTGADFSSAAGRNDWCCLSFSWGAALGVLVFALVGWAGAP